MKLPRFIRNWSNDRLHEHEHLFLKKIQNNRIDLRASTDGKHPCMIETSGEGDEHGHLSPASRSHRNLLLPNLGNLLGDELRQFNALRRCRSPVRGNGQSVSPKPRPKSDHSSHDTPSSTQEGSTIRKPNKLLIPTVSCIAPPDLSPRFIPLSKRYLLLNLSSFLNEQETCYVFLCVCVRVWLTGWLMGSRITDACFTSAPSTVALVQQKVQQKVH